MSELGSKLRDARIERGYTLNTLQQKTKIQKNIYRRSRMDSLIFYRVNITSELL